MNFNVCLCIIASLADVLKTVPRFLPTLLAVNHNFVQSVCEFIVDIASTPTFPQIIIFEVIRFWRELFSVDFHTAMLNVVLVYERCYNNIKSLPVSCFDRANQQFRLFSPSQGGYVFTTVENYLDDLIEKVMVFYLHINDILTLSRFAQTSSQAKSCCRACPSV